MKSRTILGLLMAILSIGALGCSLFSSKAGDAEMVFAATEIGTPEGDKVTKDIGPAGGTLVSPDGRMTLTVPQGALAETIPFSMQPITNKAGGGLGLAYRLEPDGKTFPTPLELTVHYDDQDLEGTVPEALAIAYQDAKGAWHGQQSARLDQDAKTLTVLTTHFTDEAFLARLRISPTKATVKVGQNLVVALTDCEEVRLGSFQGIPLPNCMVVAPGANAWSLRGAGTLKPQSNEVLYTAPAKKPTPNIASVLVTYKFEIWNPTTGEIVPGQKTFGAQITIVDRGYRATGGQGGVVYSGIICSLDEPFTVNGSWLTPIAVKFVPSSGTWSFDTNYSVMHYKGNGTYKIEGVDTDTPRIIVQGSNSEKAPHVALSQQGFGDVVLVPLLTDECK